MAQHGTTWLASCAWNFPATKQAYLQAWKSYRIELRLGEYDRNKLHPPCIVTPELQSHDDINSPLCYLFIIFPFSGQAGQNNPLDRLESLFAPYLHKTKTAGS
jgi:hypothetical protein